MSTSSQVRVDWRWQTRTRSRRQSMRERWLVTGARGFLGRRVCGSLRDRGFEVVPLDHHPPPQENGLVADLATQVPKLDEAPDVVVHLASLVHHQASGALFEQTITLGTQNLLASLDRFETGPRAFIYASSVAVYGLTSGELLPESTPPTAASPYGGSKRRAEELIADWAKPRAVAATMLRLPGLVGAGMVGSLPRLIRALERRRYVGIGPGTARRSLVLASDVAEALPSLAGCEGVFHLTDRVHPSFLDFEAAICERLGRRLPVRIPLAAARIIGRLGDLAQAAGLTAPFSSEILERTTSTLTFDDSAAVAQLGWAPRPVLEQIDRWI